MKKREPYTEPYTPEERAQLDQSMQESMARMSANAERVMAERLRHAWSDETDPPLAPAPTDAATPAMQRARAMRRAAFHPDDDHDDPDEMTRRTRARIAAAAKD